MSAEPLLEEIDDWRDDAACLGDDRPDDWFLEHGSDVGRALAICDRCPVRIDCLAFAIAHRETSGIWGGKTPDELQEIHDEARRRAVQHALRPRLRH